MSTLPPPVIQVTPTRAIATSTLWQVLSQCVMAVLSIVTVKCVAISLSQELVGNYNSAYGFLQLFGILADFGLYAVAVREVSRATDRPRILGALFMLRCIILMLSLGTALLFVWFLPLWRGTPFPLSVTIASLVPFFTLLAGVLRTTFQVHYRMHYVFIVEVTQRIITTGLIALFVIFGFRGSNDLRILFIMLGIGGFGALILFLLSVFFSKNLMTVRLSLDWKLMGTMLRRAAPFGLAYLCIAFSRQFDITMIALLRDDFQIQNAYYGFVVRMSDMGFVLPTYLLNSVLPTLSERDAKGENTGELLGKTFFTVMLIGSTTCLFALLWARPITALLTTDAYLSTAISPGSDSAFQLLSIPLLLNGMILLAFYMLLNRHSWRKLIVILLFCALLSLSLNLTLIPKYGFLGAAWTSIVVHSALAAFLFPLALREMRITLTWNKVRKWALYTVGVGGGLWLLKPFMVNEIATVIGMIVVTALIVSTGWGLRIHQELL